MRMKELEIKWKPGNRNATTPLHPPIRMLSSLPPTRTLSSVISRMLLAREMK